MIDLRTLLLATGLGLVPAVAQEPTPREPSTKEAAKSVDQWIQDLGADSYRTRVAAEKALRDQGKKALAELQKAAESSDDHEIQWRARRLVRQIERGGDQGLGPRTFVAPRWGTQGVQGNPDVMGERFQQQVERMFDQMEREFGLDIPRARFFDDEFFRDLKDQVQSRGSSQGMSMQIGPDGGIRVELKSENEKGEVETKTYEAKSMAEFEAQYPGVLQQNGLGGNFGLRFFHDFQHPMAQGFLSPRVDQQPWTALPDQQGLFRFDPATESPPAGSRLGITIRTSIPDELREHLDLPENVGLMVDSVVTGTLAEALGLQRGDIVTKIAGHDIGSAQDVQKVLGAIDAGTDVKVEFLRKGAEKTASAAKPDAPKAEEKKSDAKSRERLERRKPKDGEGTVR